MKENQLTKVNWRPDWHDVKQYPTLENTDNRQWAWEFLRRNILYQKIWDNWYAPYCDPIDLSYDSSLFNDRIDNDKFIQEAIAEGVSFSIISPMCLFKRNFWLLFPVGPYYKQNQRPVFSHDAIGYRYKPANCSEAYIIREFELQDSEVLVCFNLDMPIEKQLKSAKKLLKEQIEYRTNKGIAEAMNHRNRVGAYQSYLRILDAIAHNTPLKDIAAVIYPNLKNIYPENLGTKTVRDDLKAAECLMTTGFRFISLTPTK